MSKERLQILIEPEQRRALEREAERTGRPIGMLIRQAIDEHLGAPTVADRQAAARWMAERRVPGVPDADELARVLNDKWD